MRFRPLYKGKFPGVAAITDVRTQIRLRKMLNVEVKETEYVSR